MARRRRVVGKGHPRLFKYLTIFGATLGILSSTTFAVVMGVDAAKGDLITDTLREYTATFSSEGTILHQKTYKRGELLEIPENPEHEIDGENNYFFIGWDTNGNGFPDVVPTRAYYDFNAEAVYFKTGKFDLNFLDLLNMDLEDLLKLLQDLNIDWEQFMSMFNIDPETLMQWLMGQTVLTFETNPAPSEYPTYFRSTSYGDFDYAKKSFKNPDYYDSSLISEGSINPLSYTAYKLKMLDDAGLLPYNFGFVDYNIKFNAVEDYYPVPDCEYSNDMGEIVDSDAHYLKEPIGGTYRTSAAYVPAVSRFIDIFNAIPLTGVVGRDERAYYKYALEHYTSIPQEYERVIDDIIIKQDWYEEEINQVDAIADYVSSLGESALFNDDGSVDVNSYLNSQKKSKDPVMDLINNKKGTDLDFSTTAVMIFRRLRIPARLVKGYVSVGSESGENAITLFNQHYWTEIYVKGTGWMICECMNLEQVLGTNPYKGLNESSSPLDNNHILERITVKPPTETKHYLGETLKTAGGYITAYFSDGTNSKVNLSTGTAGVKITGYDRNKLGEQYIDVSYTYEGVTKYSGFKVTVVEQNAKLLSVDWDTTYAKKSYYQGETFSLANITAMGHYGDDSIRDISDKITLYNYDGTDVVGGPYNATISVTDTGETFRETFQYYVTERIPVSLNIISPPIKLTYYVGERLNVTGLETQVEYKNGSIVNYSFDGFASDVSPDLAEFSHVKFDYVNAHQEVQVKLWNSELGQYVYDTFEVNVVENDLLGAEAYDFKEDYYVGEYFDVNEFKQNGYIVAHMQNGYTVRFAENDYYYYDDYSSNYDMTIITPFTVDAPTLDVATNTKSATVHFEYNAVTYDVPVPIVIKAYDADLYVFAENVGITAGPGSTGFVNEQLFTFSTSYVGTMYFRCSSYEEYTPRGWEYFTDYLDYSPNGFVYDKAKQVYNTENVSITYSRDMPYGVIPMYSPSTGGDDYESSTDKKVGDTSNYSFVNFELTQENARRLTSSVIPYTGNNATYASDYKNNHLFRYRNDGSNANDLIDSYINLASHRYYNYSISSASSKVNVINKVKEDLYNEFVFNPGYKYANSNVDPLRSFFTQGVGGSKSFATAATMIFRHLGMEARYVTGFGAYSNGSGSTSVTTRNLHAWCEVWFDGAGWMIVDPTYFDTGLTRGTVGQYGAGFGGSGLYNFDKPSYSGTVSLSYDYASQFEEDDTVPVNDPSRWYAVYDDKDHTRIYTITLDPGSQQLPSYLEYRVVFTWYRNDVYIGESNGSDPYELVPTVSYGQYRLVPRLEIYDKAAQCYVTSEHDYALAPGYEDMQFFISPCFVYVYVYGTKDSYSMNGTGTVILYTHTSGVAPDLAYILDIPEDLPEKDFYSELPETIQLYLDGSFEYSGEGGTIVISPDNITCDPVGSSYTGQYHWDDYNVITIIYYGEVVITP